jgi:lipid-binding SYLF domain-containing protein
MRRRDFLIHGTLLPLAALGVAACTTSATTTATGGGEAESKTARRNREIDNAANGALDHLYASVRGARDMVDKANGVLVFPSVIAAGFGVGGQFGEGVLRARQRTLGYYSLASLSLGLQIGAQSKAIVFLFMTPDSLEQFRNSQGWSAGGNASVAVVKLGANGNLELSPTSGPVLAFVLTNAGLMANLTLEGTKITPLKQG